MTEPTVVSLFAGCGGSSLGYRMAGYRELLAVEFNENAAETFRLNFPGVPVYCGDVREFSGEEASRLSGAAPGELDVLDGSPPCQGFSTAGLRRMADERNDLFREYVRLLEHFRPRAFVMENVSGLVKGKMKLVFAQVYEALEQAGYQVGCWKLNSWWYGVPQSRERLVFIGHRKDLGLPLPRPPAPERRMPLTVGEAVSGIHGEAHERERVWLLEECADRGAFREWAQIPRGQSLKELRSAAAGKIVNFGFAAIKVNPRKPCPTVVTTNGNLGLHGLMHWSEKRKFTVAELRRVFSFPDDFAFAGKYQDAVTRMGNSVPPKMMAAVAREVRRSLETSTIESAAS